MNAKLTFWCLLFLGFPLVVTAQIDGNGVDPKVTVTTSHNQESTGAATLQTAGRLPNLTAASRFLGQSTFGASIETIEATANQGFSNWMDQQLNMPVGLSMEDYVVDLVADLRQQKIDLGEELNNVNARLHYFHSAWWQYLMDSPDVLRARVAFALSEIFVISEIPNLKDHALGLANYYDMLLENSFGNFKDLLTDVTLHPAMGVYLTHLNNPKSDPDANTFPDENYAREVMQLFTIGLFELNIDGTRKLQGGNPIPTYDNQDIAEFAKVFTGLTWFNESRFGRRNPNRESYTMPMRMHEAEHEPGVKNLLNGFQVPNRTPVDGMADIEDAMDNLFNHQNVGPFIAYRLIQRLVKSNPTPAYVGRVAQAFNNNGQGVRGDMKAVIRAILMDDEARNCAWIQEPSHGMLREPLVRNTHIAKAFDAASVNGHYHTSGNNYYFATGQRALAAPSVFNFFQTDYTPIGEIADANLVAPEFQITNASTALGYANQVNEWTFRSKRAVQFARVYKEDFTDDDFVKFDWAYELTLVEKDEDIPTLVERLNLIMMHGRMSETTRTTITNSVLQVPDYQPNERLGMAIYLVMVSPEYLILR